MPELSFVATDVEGVSHQYEVHLHPATDGQAIMWRLAALLAPALLGAIRALVPLMELFQGRSVRQVLDDPAALEVAKTALRDADTSTLGAELQKAFASQAAPDLTLALLSRAKRDGKRLDNRLAFDEAFTGNYAELLRAVWEVIKANRFFSLPGM